MIRVFTLKENEEERLYCATTAKTKEEAIENFKERMIKDEKEYEEWSIKRGPITVEWLFDGFYTISEWENCRIISEEQIELKRDDDES